MIYVETSLKYVYFYIGFPTNLVKKDTSLIFQALFEFLELDYVSIIKNFICYVTIQNFRMVNSIGYDIIYVLIHFIQKKPWKKFFENLQKNEFWALQKAPKAQGHF